MIGVRITGASTAGNALAQGRGRAGHEKTVMERAAAFRDGGWKCRRPQAPGLPVPA